MKEKFLRTDKIFHYPDRLLAYKLGKLIKPITVEIHLTNKCNLKCYYCTFKDKHNLQTLETEDAKEIIYKLKKMGVKGLTFSGGGEPTVHKDFVEIAKFAKGIGLDIALITNGVIFPLNILGLFSWVRFSVDTSSKNLYKKIKGVDRLEQVEENIRNAVNLKLQNDLETTIGYQMVVTEENFHEILKNLERAEELGVDYFQFRPLEGFTYSNSTIDSVKKIGNIMSEYLSQNRYNKVHVVDSWYKWKELEDFNYYTDCPGIDFIGAIDAYGNYCMCCHHIQDKSACYGNLLELTPEEIFINRSKIQQSFNYRKCPIACRGAVINRRLSKYEKIEHISFL